MQLMMVLRLIMLLIMMIGLIPQIETGYIHQIILVGEGETVKIIEY